MAKQGALAKFVGFPGCCILLIFFSFAVGAHGVEVQVQLVTLAKKAGSAQAEPSIPHLFDRLKQVEFKRAFDALFSGERQLEPWLAKYIESRNGVDFSGSELQVQGVVYESYQICRPHSCPGNVLYVIFKSDGSKAWALFTKDDNTSRFFGGPDAAMRALLNSLREQGG